MGLPVIVPLNDLHCPSQEEQKWEDDGGKGFKIVPE